eukprot:s701_g16.t1
MRTGEHALPPPKLCSESCPGAMAEDQEEVKIESVPAVDPPEEPKPEVPAVMMACDPVWQALLNVYEVHRQELLQAELVRKEMSSDGGVTSKVLQVWTFSGESESVARLPSGKLEELSNIRGLKQHLSQLHGVLPRFRQRLLLRDEILEETDMLIRPWHSPMDLHLVLLPFAVVSQSGRTC